MKRECQQEVLQRLILRAVREAHGARVASATELLGLVAMDLFAWPVSYEQFMTALIALRNKGALNYDHSDITLRPQQKKSRRKSRDELAARLLRMPVRGRCA